MATLTLTSQATLMELAQAEHNAKLMPIVNVLSEVNEILLDAQWAECNNRTTHKGLRASTEPTGTERQYNQGIDPEFATTTPFDEPTCMLDGLSKVDAALLRHSPDGLAERLQRDKMYMRGMSKTFANRLIYGDRGTYPDRINGITVREGYNELSDAYTYDNAGGNASATENKMSIIIVGWGPGKVRLIYPRNDAPGGSKVLDPDVVGLGIRVKDFGLDLVTDANDKEYPGYRTWLEIHFGLMIEDPRYIRRIVNISRTNIDGIDDFSFNEDYLIDAFNDMPDWDGCAIYVPRAVRGQIWKRVKDKGNVYFTPGKDVFGRPQAQFMEIPIRLVDQMSGSEAEVT